MKTFFSRILAPAVLVLAAIASPALAAPPQSVAITSPADGATIAVSSPTPTVTITATAVASGGAGGGPTISSIEFRVNGVSIGSVVGGSASVTRSITWTPSGAGTFTLTATASDSSSATGNTLTSSPITVTIAPYRTAAVTAPASGTTFAQGSQTFLRATASMSDGVVKRVEFFLTGPSGTTSLGAATNAPYSRTVTFSQDPGSYTLFARATASDDVTTFDSATIPITIAPAVGTGPTATITAPSSSDTIAASSAVTFSAVATDTDGGSITGVTFYADGEQVGTTDTTAPYSVTWTPTLVKSYTLTVLAIDNNSNARFSSPVTINVLASAPTVSITAPANNSSGSVGVAQTITANATPSTGSTIANVEFFVNGASIGTDSTAPYSLSWTPNFTGAIVLTARATDSNGVGVTSSGVTINVTSTATPTATITSPASGATIAQGSDSYVRAMASMPGFVIKQVEFFLTGPGGTTSLGVATTAPYSRPVTFSSAAGSYTLFARATASDDVTTVDSPAVPITIAAPVGSAPAISIAAPTSGDAINTSSNVSFTAIASDADGSISNVTFFVDGEQIGTDSSAPYSVTWVPASAKSYVLTAIALDNQGNARISAPVTVTAVVPTPSVSITAPASNAQIPVDATVPVSAAVTAGPGLTILNVQFFANGALIGTDTQAPFSVNWTPTVPGPVSLTARATDSATGVTLSSSVGVTVVGSTGPFTVTMAMVGSSSVPAGSSRVVTATPNPAGGVDRVELLLDETVIATDSVAPYSFIFTAPNSVGLHKLNVRAINTVGQTATSNDFAFSVTGAVGAPPSVAILTPTANAFVAPGTATTISGSAIDSDGTITGVQVFVNDATTGLANSGTATISGANWSITWTTPTVPGVASITAIATDNNGNAIAAPAIGVNIADAASPAITLGISPVVAGQTPSTTFPSGAVRNFVANVTPGSGRAIMRVEFFVDGTKVGEDTQTPYTFRYTAPDLAPGEMSRSLVFSARATDNAGAARDVQVPLLVVSPLGAPPTVNLLTPANNASTVPGTAVSLAATAVANGGTITSVQFYANGSPLGINGGNALTNPPYVTSFTPTVPGTYVIDAIATDDRGNTSISNAATITAAFTTPSIAITTPNPNATARATPNVPLNIAATATVQSGTGSSVLLVEFLLDGVQIGADTTPPYTFSWTPTTAQLGMHRLTARVTDTNGQTATSAPVTVNVANLVGTPPTVSISTQPIPPQGLQTLSTVNFLANAAASATGVTITNVEFFLNDVSIGTATREQQSNIYRLAYDFSRFDFSTAPSVTDPTTGVTRYTPIPLYAIARDSNNNQTVSPTANLTINPSTSLPPQVQPVQNLLGPTTTITQGQQFPAGIISSDPDGTVTLIQLVANGSIVASQANPAQGQVLFWTPNVTGRFNITAIATDDTGNTSIASPAITVQVNPVIAPTTSITRPSDDTTITSVGAPVFLEGTATSASANQIPTLVFIVTGTGGANRTQLLGQRVGTTNTYRQIWTPSVPDTYSIITQANVGTAQSTSTVTRRVTVRNLQGLAPTVSIAGGVPNTAQTASTSNFTATATDPDGSVVEVEFFLNRNSIGQASKDPIGNTWRLSVPFAGVLPGNVEVVALARDSSGNVAASTTNTISVTAAQSIAPTITIEPSTTNAAFNRQVQLRANARDTDGTITNVQYFTNATSRGSSNNAGTNYQVNWTPNESGRFLVWAVATDNSGVTSVSPTVEVVVRRNNPIVENAAFILQTYQDIANTPNINPIVFDQLDAQLASGELSRADIIVKPLTANENLAMVDLPGFQAPIQLLAAYYVLMGEWPTPTNYNLFLATARGSLANAIGSILNSNEYFAKYGVVPTTALLNNVNSAIPARTFLARLHQNAGLPPPSDVEVTRFINNPTLNVNLGIGRGYIPVGLNVALAEFITIRNATNTALMNKARTAALFYQLNRPQVAMTVEQITARIDTLLAMPDLKAVVSSLINDILYRHRYVTITRQPNSLVLAPRSGAIFSVEADGASPLAFQWLLNGAPIPGATNATLSLTNVDATRVGTYTAVVTSPVGTDRSDPATLTLSTAPTRLVNISTRGVTTGAGANLLIGGFVVTGTGNQTRQMLIRVVGPRLGQAPFNVSGFMADPRLEVFAGNNQTPVLTNDNWGTQTGGAAQVTAIQQATNRAGAFPLANNSNDAVVLATLPPGLYTVQAKAPANNLSATGIVLIEVYDVTQGGPAGPKAANVSTRGLVGTGANVMIAGFVVTGEVSRRVLIRGAGPTLQSFGLPANTLLADPQLTLIDQETGRTIRTNNDWAASDDAAIIAAAARTAGAFPFANGSRDSAMIVMLPPGGYTVQLSGANNGTGIGIVEVYDVDP